MNIKWKDTIGTYVNNFYINDIKVDKDKNTLAYVTCPLCGKKKWILTYCLSKQKSCGCLRNRYKDISKERFGRLVVVKIAKKNNKRKNYDWVCVCDCGNECIVNVSDLIAKKVKSCGCLLKENWDGKTDNMIKENKEKYFVESTYVPRLNSNVTFKNNKSGTRGVCWDKRKNKWHAYIYFQKKRYRLGFYEEKQDAIKARKEAEEQIYGNFLKWYENTNSAVADTTAERETNI